MVGAAEEAFLECRRLAACLGLAADTLPARAPLGLTGVPLGLTSASAAAVDAGPAAAGRSDAGAPGADAVLDEPPM
jgi:hypothetical protein